MLEDQSPSASPVAASTEPDEDETDLLTRLGEHVQKVARRPETKFGAGGLVLGALGAVAVLGSLLQPPGVEEARADARLAIERLAIVQARLDALDGGHAATSTEHATEGDHASTDTHAAAGDTEHAAEKHGDEEHAETKEVHWSYAGDTGPGKWGSLAHEYAACASGREQSPIDLAKGQIEGAQDLEFHYASSAASILDNGHAIQVDVAEGSYMLLGERRFDLVQFHFHGPSEHTVGGRSYPLELHLVHKDATGKLAVVGVLVEAGGNNAVMKSVLDVLPTTQGKAESMPKAIDPGKLLPALHSTFQYSGSLTTPPCTEGVAWSVMVAPITMAEAQIESLRSRLEGNNRPIQPLHDRSLFVDFGTP